MSDRPHTPLLDTVQYPQDIRNLSKDQLPQLAIGGILRRDRR